MNRIRHKDVERACERYNAALNLSRDDARYLRWADIRGDGVFRPNLYAMTGRGGVTRSHLNRRTMRQTIDAINLAIRFAKLKSFCLIIQAIHERGKTQVIALDELNRRGLWLSPEQRKQAGLE